MVNLNPSFNLYVYQIRSISSKQDNTDFTPPTNSIERIVSF